MTTYSMQGVKWVNWVIEPSACEKCLGIAEGGPYLLKDAPSIPDDTHPNCRCSKIPRTIPEPDLWPAMLAMKDFKSLAENSDDLTDEKKQTITDKNNGYVGTSNSFNTNDAYRDGTSNELSDANKKTVGILKRVISRRVTTQDMVGERYMDHNYADGLLSQIKPKSISEFVGEFNMGKYTTNEFGFTSKQ